MALVLSLRCREKMMALGEFPFVSLNKARELYFAARKSRPVELDPMVERKAEDQKQAAGI
jgi:hypothetical protein